MNRSLIAAMLAAASFSTTAADFYVVVPVKGRTANSSPISVALSGSTLPGATVGTAYSYSFNQNLQVIGDASYSGYGVTWSIAAGSLPPGLTLNNNTGLVSGTPTTNGTSSFVLSAAYKTKTGTQSYQIPVSLAVSLALAAAVPPQGIVGNPYSFNLSSLLSVSGDNAYNGSGVTWSVVATTLPAGLYLTSDGYIGGTPTSSGSGTITARASYRGVNGEQTYQVVTRVITVSLDSATLPTAVVGSAFSYDLKQNLHVSGDSGYNIANTSWTVDSGTLPAGLTLSSNGVIVGTPTAATSGQAFTVRATYQSTSGAQSYQIISLLYAATRTPGSLSFSGTQVNSTSPVQTVTLENTGTAPLDVTAPTITGSFSVDSTTCGTTLPVAANCTYNITFKPTNSGGFTGNLSGRTTAGSWAVSLGGNSVMPAGQVAYTTPGTYTWTAPAGVTAVSVVAVGAGSAGGGGLGWKNNIAVNPGQTYTVVVGAAATGHITPYAAGSSYFINATTVSGNGSGGYTGGTFVGDGGGNGGDSPSASGVNSGGGAGGYAGAGGGSTMGTNAPAGGGGGAGNKNSGGWPGGGGGVGLLGQGASGLGGTATTGAGGGSGGAAGTSPGSSSSGGAYGGGGTCASSLCARGAGGAVRIIWGTGRAFPSTLTTDQ